MESVTISTLDGVSTKTMAIDSVVSTWTKPSCAKLQPKKEGY